METFVAILRRLLKLRVNDRGAFLDITSLQNLFLPVIYMGVLVSLPSDDSGGLPAYRRKKDREKRKEGDRGSAGETVPEVLGQNLTRERRERGQRIGV